MKSLTKFESDLSLKWNLKSRLVFQINICRLKASVDSIHQEVMKDFQLQFHLSTSNSPVLYTRTGRKLRKSAAFLEKIRTTVREPTVISKSLKLSGVGDLRQGTKSFPITPSTPLVHPPTRPSTADVRNIKSFQMKLNPPPRLKPLKEKSLPKIFAPPNNQENRQ